MNTHTLCFYSQTKRLPASEVLKCTLCNAILCPMVIPRICACGKQILIGWKLFFWIHGPVTADTSHSGRPTNNSLSRYDVSAATGPSIQNSNFNQWELIKRTRKFAAWPLDMYHSVGHVSPCIVWSEKKKKKNRLWKKRKSFKSWYFPLLKYFH